jgi:hypothetical protein
MECYIFVSVLTVQSLANLLQFIAQAGKSRRARERRKNYFPASVVHLLHITLVSYRCSLAADMHLNFHRLHCLRSPALPCLGLNAAFRALFPVEYTISSILGRPALLRCVLARLFVCPLHSTNPLTIIHANYIRLRTSYADPYRCSFSSPPGPA